MIDLDISGDTKNLERHLLRFQRKAIPKAATRAVNRVIKTAQGTAAREIAKDTAYKVKEARSFLHVRKATWRRIEAKILAERHAPNLIHFGATQFKAGVKAKPYKKRQLFKGAFIAPKKRLVFTRRTPRRLPIKALVGPSIPAEFKRDYIRRIYASKAAERWPIEMRQAINYYLSKI